MRSRIAGAAGRMRVFDFSFDLNETYTFWSGIIGGTFLMLSYFGTDQSQVQRYLTARVGGRGAQLAADERVLEDPAAGADPAHRRAGVRLLPVPAAAAAVQPGARAPRAAAPTRRRTARSRRVTGAGARQIAARRGARAAPRGRRCRAPTTAFRAAEAAVQEMRTEALAARRDGSPARRRAT